MDSVFFIHTYIIGEVSINLSYIRTGGYLHALPNPLQLMCSVVCFFCVFGGVLCGFGCIPDWLSNTDVGKNK